MRKTYYTSGQMIDLLKKKAVCLQAVPTQTQVTMDKNMPSSSMYRHRFGSFSKAVREAGLEPQKQGKKNKYADDELLEKLRDLASEMGRSPTAIEAKVRKGFPSEDTYIRRFNGWNNALQKAGLTIIPAKGNKKMQPCPWWKKIFSFLWRK